MQDEIEKAKAQAAQLAALTSSSTVMPPRSLREMHQIYLSKLVDPNQSTLDSFIVRVNQEALENSSMPYNRDNFKKLFLEFHIANKLSFSFVEKNQTLQRLLNYCAKAPIDSDLKISKIPSRQSLTTYTINAYHDMKVKVRQILLEQEALNFTTDIWTSEIGNLYIYYY